MASPANLPATMPQFSVVVPLYNKAPYVRAAIESVLAQTCGDLEVVVVDDGSTDGGPDVVRAIRDPRVRLVQQANAGVSAARNRGIEAACGEWVAFLDADDWHHPRYLEVLQQVQQRHPQVDAVAARFVRIPDHGPAAPSPWVVPQEPAVELVEDLPSRWMRGETLFTGSIAIRRSRLQAMQPCFAPGEHIGEDLDLWFRVAEQTPIALAHAPLAAYRVGVQGSLTGGMAVDTFPPWVERLRQRARSPAMGPARRASTLDYIAQLELDMARNLLARGRRRDAIGWLLRARRAVSSRRWWLTAFMAAWPQQAARRWVQRGAVVLPAAEAAGG